MLSVSQFIERSKKTHGEKYSYEKIQFINSKTKVIIICDKHGEFEQTPNHHMNGQGCAKCSGVYKMNTDEFIISSKNIFGEQFDYNNTTFNGLYKKVTLTCKIHGDFEQYPSNHLKGFGCSRCSGNKKLTTDEFIEKSKIKHGNRYNYNLVEYKNSETKVKIVCEIHGTFEQTPYQHLHSKGCSECSGSKKLSESNFIELSKKTHGDKYIYDDVYYRNNKTKVNIRCSKHGILEQTPNHHMRGI